MHNHTIYLHHAHLLAINVNNILQFLLLDQNIYMTVYFTFPLSPSREDCMAHSLSVPPLQQFVKYM